MSWLRIYELVGSFEPVKELYELVGFELVLKYDLDGSFEPAKEDDLVGSFELAEEYDLDGLFEPVEEYDLVQSFELAEEDNVVRSFSWLRSMISIGHLIRLKNTIWMGHLSRF